MRRLTSLPRGNCIAIVVVFTSATCVNGIALDHKVIAEVGRHTTAIFGSISGDDTFWLHRSQ